MKESLRWNGRVFVKSDGNEGYGIRNDEGSNPVGRASEKPLKHQRFKGFVRYLTLRRFPILGFSWGLLLRKCEQYFINCDIISLNNRNLTR